MKQLFCPILILLSCTYLSCKKEDISKLRQTTFDAPFEVTLNEKVAVKKDDYALTAVIKNISEYGCEGKNPPCDEQDKAVVRIELSDNRKFHAESLLCLGCAEDGPPESLVLHLDDKTLTVYLLDIKPATGSAGAPYVQLSIKEN